MNGKSLTQGEMEKFYCEAEIQIGNKTTIVNAVELLKNPGQLMCAFPTKVSYISMTIRVKNSNVIINQNHLMAIPECTKEYIQISTQNKIETSSAGEFIQFKFESNFDFETFSVFVMAKGNLVHQSIGNQPFKSNTGSFTLKITNEMNPFSTITVFTISPKSNLIISDSYILVTDVFFNNDLSIENPRLNYQPNELAKFNVTTDPKSQVFLLGVDEAIFSMGTGNDITNKRVIDELVYLKNNFNEGNDIFSNKDTYFKTDYGRECKSVFYSPNKHHTDDDDDHDEPINKDGSGRIREMLSETWIWDSFNM